MLPRNQSISVFGTTKRFKIILPFYYSPAELLSDGFDDIVVSKPTLGSNVVVFGNLTFLQSRSTSELTSRKRGWEIEPAVSNDFSGRSVANAGDINGDGHDDLIIGVPRLSCCYLMFGTTEGFVNMTQGFVIFGDLSALDSFGWAVSGAGDVNGDGYDDIVIGAPFSGSGGQGAAYVLFGRASHFRNVVISDLTQSATLGFVISGEFAADNFGLSVSGAGDVNRDGFDDVIVGALRTTHFQAGAAYILFGRRSTAINLINIGNMTSTQGVAFFGKAYDRLGCSVSQAGE